MQEIKTNSFYNTNYKNRVNEILSKFKNGIELYDTNSIFRNCIENLLEGGNVYHIIEDLILMDIEILKKYEELIKSGVIRTEIVVSKKEFDDIISKL